MPKLVFICSVKQRNASFNFNLVLLQRTVWEGWQWFRKQNMRVYHKLLHGMQGLANAKFFLYNRVYVFKNMKD